MDGGTKIHMRKKRKKKKKDLTLESMTMNTELLMDTLLKSYSVVMITTIQKMKKKYTDSLITLIMIMIMTEMFHKQLKCLHK